MIQMGNRSFTTIDLTHDLQPGIPSWSGGCNFELNTILDYSECPGDVKFHAQSFALQAGAGTHMDAPAHCMPGGTTIDKLSPDKLFAPAIKIDISDRAHERYSLSQEDILTWEQEHSVVPTGSIALIYTGWEKHWNNPDRYRNELVFPAVSAEAATLMRDRGIIGLGIDTLSPDRPESGFLVHQTLLHAGIYIVENVANAHQLPSTGAYVSVMPLKIVGGTESPVRLVGFIPKL